ncbi:SpoIID/LytB domain-containing protein [Odoribacter sp. OttesenSCG-928-J03]|nr:SpoIID/LytB domain-containing protein [Odoribacter sp. OttesenSCG-928-J03]MDL2330867.1 SpoIID/LytB domain-containing protein [Odoribacter sp. OttesenSCG-928-A06]
MNLSVGIISAPEINFRLKESFNLNGSEQIFNGAFSIFRRNNKTYLTQTDHTQEVQLPLLFTPTHGESCEFELTDVTIGIQFHWERKENQRFRGILKFIEENGQITAINILDIEEYLLSVISSEMNATSSLELLKAHAVISRSWLLAQQEKAQLLHKEKSVYTSVIENENEYIRWFDREDHSNFDVCADDHCQRYQGISRISTPLVEKAVKETAGEVLMYDNRVCDARFSKCCGGVSERFENVWEPVVHPYLTHIYDASTNISSIDLTKEQDIRQWINSSPDVFCNTTDKNILSDVLNDYDLETTRFFRWEEHFTSDEISELVKERLSVDFGQITDLIPIERGESGRLIKLKIVGTKKTLTIGKELIIRKAFSKSHLYSSAFIIEKKEEEGVVQGFTLRGSGWGHGVGLCQIGAAVMGHQGYSYKEILLHYFKGAVIEKTTK